MARDKRDWMKLSARLRRHVQHTAGRTDLITRIAPMAGAPAACFVPALAEVRFNADALLRASDDPSVIDPDNVRDRRQHAALMGAAYHEAAHAAHTRLGPRPGARQRVMELATLLEEPRIEAALVAVNPKYRPFLRASCQQVLGLSQGGEVPATLRALILVEGRHQAGVLDASDTADVVSACRAAMGDETVTQVVDILAEAVTVADDDVDGLLQLATQLADLVKEPESPAEPPAESADGGSDGDASGGLGASDRGGDEDKGDPSGEEGSEPAAGEGGPGTGGADGTGDDDAGGEPGTGRGHASRMPCGSWTQGDIPDGTDPFAAPPASPATQVEDQQVEQVAADMAREVAAEARDQLAPRPAPKVTVQDVAEQQDRDMEQGSARHVFSASGYTPLATRYAPSPELLAETRRLTALLRAASYRGSDVTRIANPAPPGRMSTAELMRREAQQQLGLRVSATPWKQKRRREVDNPRLVVGIAGDVSSSMQPWQRGTAHLTYALSSAIRAMDGTVAAVAWHDMVGVTLKPRERQLQVAEVTCQFSTTALPEAVRALAGQLGMVTNQNPVRVLVVVTDGDVSNPVECRYELARLQRAGVHVLLVGPRRITHLGDVTSLVLPTPRDGVEFARDLGQAIADLLRA